MAAAAAHPEEGYTDNYDTFRDDFYGTKAPSPNALRGERQSKRMCIFHWTRWLPSSIHLLLAWGWVANTKRHEHYIP
jgi:hypothetical protein